MSSLSCFFWNLVFSPLEQFLTLPVVIKCPSFTHSIVVISLIIVIFLSLVYDADEVTFLSKIQIKSSPSIFYIPEMVFFQSKNYSFFWQTELHNDVNLWKKTTRKSLFKKVQKLTNIEFFFSALYNFITSIVKDNLLVNTYIYIPILYFIFLFILFSNLLGLIPFSVTTTGSFILIIYFALSIFIGINIIGLLIQKTKYFNLFLPNGVPLVIAPALVVIEFFSYIARVLSLSIRLFANMVAGHSLLKILVTSIWHVIVVLSLAFWPIIIISWFILLPIFLLECVIAILQAYVFTLLLVLYLNDVINLH